MKTSASLAFEYAYVTTADPRILKIDKLLGKL
jgi:hypothetical protein